MPIKFLSRKTNQPVNDGIVYVNEDVAAPATKPELYSKAFTGTKLPGSSYSLSATPGMGLWWTVDNSKVAAVDFIDSLQNGGVRAPNIDDPNSKHTSIHRMSGSSIAKPVTGQLDWKTAPIGDHSISLIAYDDNDQEIFRISRTVKVSV